MKNLENFQDELINAECLVGGDMIRSMYEDGFDVYNTETGEMHYE